MRPFVKNNIEKIQKNILAQAKYFLDDADEFFPFGAAIDKNDIIKPIGIYSEDEQPDSQILYEQLEASLKNGLMVGEYLMVAIALDVYVHVSQNRKKEKAAAIQIKFFSHENELESCHLYKRTSAGYSFEPYEMS